MREGFDALFIRRWFGDMLVFIYKLLIMIKSSTICMKVVKRISHLPYKFGVSMQVSYTRKA